MRHRLLISFFTIMMCGINLAQGGLRGPGKYNGIVLFDRWDGCYLYSGIYLMYISELQKETVRKYAGKALVLDATKVMQPMNPGDGRLEAFTSLGLSADVNSWDKIGQLTMTASFVSDDPIHPVLKIIVRNKGLEPLVLQADELALTVFTKKPVPSDPYFLCLAPTDGPSYALVTRQSLFGHGTSRWSGERRVEKQQISWTVRNQEQTVKNFDLASGEVKEFIVDFNASAGEYDFVFGYGGGVHASLAVACNLIAVDVDAKGRATLVNISGR